MINSLKGIITVLDSILLQWSVKRTDWTKLKKMMMGRTMVTVLVNFENFVDPFIYFGIWELSAALERQLKLAKTVMISLYASFFWLINISTVFGGLVLVLVVQVKLKRFYRSFLVIPFELVELKRSLKQKLMHKNIL